MNSTRKTIKISFTSPMLGTVPKNKGLYADFVAGKIADEAKAVEEIETAQEIEEKGWTGFHQDEKGLFIYDYMIRGFLKAACEVLQAGGEIGKITAYKKWFDLLVFIHPRRIYLGVDKPDDVLERPIRAMTAQGPRVGLTRSDMINAGRQIEFEIEILDNKKAITWDLIDACLAYGKYVGLGQWRGSGGYGQFEVIE